MKQLVIIFVLIFVVACGKNGSSKGSTSQTQAITSDPLKYVELISPDGHAIRTSIAYKLADQIQGLQGYKTPNSKTMKGNFSFI